MQTAQERMEALEAELALYKTNGPVGLYYEANRLVNETVAEVRKMKINANATDTVGQKKNDIIAGLMKTAQGYVKWMAETKETFKLTDNETIDKSKPISFLDKNI